MPRYKAILRHPSTHPPLPAPETQPLRGVLEIRTAAAVEDEAHGFAALRRTDLLADVLLRLAKGVQVGRVVARSADGDLGSQHLGSILIKGIGYENGWKVGFFEGL